LIRLPLFVTIARIACAEIRGVLVANMSIWRVVSGKVNCLPNFVFVNSEFDYAFNNF
jgi:hypothetical protein